MDFGRVNLDIDWGWVGWLDGGFEGREGWRLDVVCVRRGSMGQ